MNLVTLKVDSKFALTCKNTAGKNILIVPHKLSMHSALVEVFGGKHEQRSERGTSSTARDQ